VASGASSSGSVGGRFLCLNAVNDDPFRYFDKLRGLTTSNIDLTKRLNQHINQLIDPSTHQSINQSITQALNQSIHQSIT